MITVVGIHSLYRSSSHIWCLRNLKQYTRSMTNSTNTLLNPRQSLFNNKFVNCLTSHIVWNFMNLSVFRFWHLQVNKYSDFDIHTKLIQPLTHGWLNFLPRCNSCVSKFDLFMAVKWFTIPNCTVLHHKT